MYEVELKVAADHDAVRERLEAVGADALAAVEQADTYYDHPERDFAETDEALRVRRERSDEGDVDRITYKGPKVDPDSKTREEVETSVGAGGDADDIFRALGFDPVATVEKEREHYAYEGYTVTLDSVAGVGDFVEVETEAEDVDAAREGAKAVMRDLGLDPDEQVRTSYLGLLLADADE
ncbi:class IV adenylate cyclase [Halomicrobium salinisoli]|uniref:class IV adenylate cyclase n=1 Tax=Halomicrobium salinisoli TaxID=2878391 RepID=UPI001CEFD2EC|nr:class IV adenylate cyclase [Halomicrobium salinisoli]